MAVAGLLLVVLLDNLWLLVAQGYLGIVAGVPDLALITALYIGFRARDTSELGLAVLLGIFVDCFSARPLGFFAFLYGTAAYFTLKVRRYVPPDALVTHIVACLVCGIAIGFVALFLAVITVHVSVGPGLWHSLAEAAANAVACPVVFGVLDRSGFFRRALGGRGYEFAR